MITRSLNKMIKRMNNIALTNDEKDLLEKILCLGYMATEFFGEDYYRYENTMEVTRYHLYEKLQSALELSESIWG